MTEEQLTRRECWCCLITLVTAGLAAFTGIGLGIAAIWVWLS